LAGAAVCSHAARIPFGFSYRQLQPIRIGRALGAHLTLRRAETLVNKKRNMADRVFTGAIVLPDRVIENSHVLVGDGKVLGVGAGAVPAGDKHAVAR
jgi:hypothetical protein